MSKYRVLDLRLNEQGRELSNLKSEFKDLREELQEQRIAGFGWGYPHKIFVRDLKATLKMLMDYFKLEEKSTPAKREIVKKTRRKV